MTIKKQTQTIKISKKEKERAFWRGYDAGVEAEAKVKRTVKHICKSCGQEW